MENPEPKYVLIFRWGDDVRVTIANKAALIFAGSVLLGLLGLKILGVKFGL